MILDETLANMTVNKQINFKIAISSVDGIL